MSESKLQIRNRPSISSSLRKMPVRKVLKSFQADVNNYELLKDVLVLLALQSRYKLDFAGHLEQIYQADTLHKTIEYMRKHI